MATNTVTKEQVQEIMDNSEFEVIHKVFGKQCIVVAKLPNGFTVVGESACVDPSNYDETIGANIAKARIENKIWELEGYKLQNALS
ncbi:Gp49 family protein [Paenibacillus sp. FSL R7-0026]|uniref:Gp49 family protein n=1 Tax=Paenibacillus sp. FSL R7-0026 TaxID=2921668 RepID=UPI0030F576CC